MDNRADANLGNIIDRCSRNLYTPLYLLVPMLDNPTSTLRVVLLGVTCLRSERSLAYEALKVILLDLESETHLWL